MQTCRNHIRRFLMGVLCCACLASLAAAQDVNVFEIDALNAGLPDMPPDLDRRTPQGAVESFLDAAGRDDFARAAHLLDLGEVDPSRQAARGPELARQLHDIIQRRAVITWRSLLERPDALNAEQSANAAMAGQARRSILIDVLNLDGREAAIRLNRVKPPDGEPAWVFSRRTVDQVPQLHRLYGPSRLELMLPAYLREESLIGLRRWEILGLPLVLLVATLGARMAYGLFHRLSRRADRYWTTAALKALRWPSILVIVTTIVALATTYLFTVSGTVSAVLSPLIVIGYITALLLFALEVIDIFLERIVTFDSVELSDPDNHEARAQATLLSAGRRALIVVAILIGVGVTLSEAGLYRSLGFSLLASAGAVTLVLGFAAREVLGNIMASLQIAMNRSARIGDRVIYEGEWCTVERIHFTFVQLRVWNGNRLIVPVSSFVTDKFENWSLETGAMTWVAKLTLAPGADLDALRERFLALVDQEDRISPKEDAQVVVLSQDAFGIVVRFEMPSDDPATGWAMRCDMHEALLHEAAMLEAEIGEPVLARGVETMQG